MSASQPHQHVIADLFVCGPVAMLLWSETAVLHGRGPSVRDLLG
ncbi:hypothetical protein ACFRAQ_01990 [Nocardia sp. NPDC056611]